MDAETDFGLFEWIVILGMIGIAVYFVYKTFAGTSSCVSSAAQSVKNAIAQVKQSVAANVNCIKAQPSNQANSMNYTVKISCCSSLNWAQRTWNSLFGWIGKYSVQCTAQATPGAACKVPMSAVATGGGCPPVTLAQQTGDPYLCTDWC